MLHRLFLQWLLFGGVRVIINDIPAYRTAIWVPVLCKKDIKEVY